MASAPTPRELGDQEQAAAAPTATTGAGAGTRADRPGEPAAGAARHGVTAPAGP
ncbi:hypothetical protein [Streptomyces sp. GC420]|uniref:hypothetical protein n=1 Tax=Streptomyces sp. GC420 TaxID=2697568 RepID=UPI0014150B6B|nr:hypothetical protein [Streptomyces sp. GC420]NBM16957.1 hypothetical protein [Streptomyces sp. GC420]